MGILALIDEAVLVLRNYYCILSCLEVYGPDVPHASCRREIYIILVYIRGERGLPTIFVAYCLRILEP